jgi:hypothetical protein
MQPGRKVLVVIHLLFPMSFCSYGHGSTYLLVVRLLRIKSTLIIVTHNINMTLLLWLVGGSMFKKNGPQILYADATLNITTSLSIWSGIMSYGIYRRVLILSPSVVISSQQLTMSETICTG